ncbi:homoserine O-succinyltransferase MetA [Acidicapsa acidisoli]|uniref:homoserine O-succinyltransferase MetA n=1 Tax=Acidicapsa acidisoli TaxID=1615681 RepID=UPI0021DFE5C7|nr:homoserine O-succinyltransferase [Acidicapsa acidisoli]
MPAYLNSIPSSKHLNLRCLNIGLINNMPDGALEATERQFLSLLNAASDATPEGITVRLSLYSLPGIPRNEIGASRIRNFYTSTETFLDTHFDGLIVTGREPLTPNLQDEPYWDSFTKVLEWARENTHSTVWSCLAAHAAALHMDGVTRVRSPHKHCGVFDCAQLASHTLTEGTPARFSLPHSRWNGLPEDALTASGYNVLTRSSDVGVDTFVKQFKSLFLFFQGHPEYESNTLLLEYRRDVGRFLRQETKIYPLMPRNYFAPDTVQALTALQRKAENSPDEKFLAEVSDILEKLGIENTWAPTAQCIYKNWLQYILAQKNLKNLDRQHADEANPLHGETATLASAASLP